MNNLTRLEVFEVKDLTDSVVQVSFTPGPMASKGEPFTVFTNG